MKIDIVLAKILQKLRSILKRAGSGTSSFVRGFWRRLISIYGNILGGAISLSRGFCWIIKRIADGVRKIRIGIGVFYKLLGIAVIIHVILIIWHCPDNASSKHILDANIPFNLLMFGLIMASFMPMLVYSYMVNLLTGTKTNKSDLKSEENELLRKEIVGFRDAIDFLVNQSTVLITMAVLVGTFAFIETHIQIDAVTPFFLFGYYLWYFVVSIIWSFGQIRFTEVGEKLRGEWPSWWKYALSIYLWIIAYIGVSVYLLLRYQKNHLCPNSVVWLKFLVILTSLWLLQSSVLWIIPSDQYHPMWSLKESLFKRKES